MTGFHLSSVGSLVRASIPVVVVSAAILLTTKPVAAQAARPMPCESLTSVSLSNVKITSVETIAAGMFRQPGGGQQNVPPIHPRTRVTLAHAGFGLGYNGGRPNARYEELPAFCRVTATLSPTPSSDIRAEVWLP